MLKIKNLKFERGMIRYETNNPKRSDFVYFEDQFNNLDEVKQEIQRSIDQENQRNTKKQKKIKKIKKGFDKQNG